MKNILFVIALVFAGIEVMGQATRSVSYNYFHSVVIADANNGDPCAPGSPNCTGGGLTPATTTNSCGNPVSTMIYTQGTYSRFYKVPDENLTTLQSLRYILKNKSQGNKVIYDFTVSRGGGGWSSSTPTVTTDPNNDYTFVGSFTQNANIIVNNAEGNIKIETPAISMLYANASDDLEQTIIPTLTSCTQVTSGNGFDYPAAGCLAVTNIVQEIPGVVASNGQTSANGAMLYDVKFSSESADRGGWYLLDGRAINATTIPNPSAREAASLKFGANLPNMDGLYTVAETTSGQDYNLSGVVNNEITVTNSNIHSATLAAQSAGGHSHSVFPPGNYGWVGYNGTGTITSSYGFDNSAGEPSLTFATNSAGSTSGDGAHTHNVLLGQGTPVPISIQPRSAKLYQLVYLGE